METKQIKSFATKARTLLKEGVCNKIMLLGFDRNGHINEADMPKLAENATIFKEQVIEGELFYHKWMDLYLRIQHKGFEEVCEEAAYTWFNRIMAIHILAQNGLIVPELDFEDPVAMVPRIVANARRGQTAFLSDQQRKDLQPLLFDDDKTYEQFQILITAFCQTNPIISACFGGITAYTELLLPSNILAKDGLIDMLNNTSFIKEDDYKQSELIGWLYQFYISEKKDKIFASFDKGKKAQAADIPAATQIFTPNWIVKYMVENTLGRIYLDNNPDSSLGSQMKYLVPPETSTPTAHIFTYDSLRQLTCADLSCGSGHILNQFFDLLYQIYLAEGYLPQQAIEGIFTHNLVGVDLDTRAKQLSMFALLLKACQRDNSFADAHCLPLVLDMPEPWSNKQALGQALNDCFRGVETTAKREQLLKAFQLLEQAENLGSIMQFDISDSTRLMIQQTVNYWKQQSTIPDNVARLLHSLQLILVLTNKYAAICMNPPYMGSRNMNAELSKYVKKHYKKGKADLFSVFMLLAANMLQEKGKYGMINMHSWMFLSSFEALRKSLLNDYQVDNLLHLGPRTFDELSGEVVQNVAFVVTRHAPTFDGSYYRLVSGKDCADKENMFLRAKTERTPIDDRENKFYYPNISQKNFEKIPGCPIGYWVTSNVMSIFEQQPALATYSSPRKGNSTSNNARFLRLWYEVNSRKMALGYSSVPLLLSDKKRWVPYNKGGGCRKWYGYNESMIDWKDNAKEIRDIPTSVITNEAYYMKPGLTWSTISSGSFGVRYFEEGYIFDNGGCCLFDTGDKRNFIAGLLNSKVLKKFVEVLSPTLNYQSGIISLLPVNYQNNDRINLLAWNNRNISKQDWDAHETSWDFEANPLVALRNRFIEEGDPQTSFTLSAFVNEFKTLWEDRFRQLHANEEELNRQFIEIYGLQDELTPDVPKSEITILQQGEISVEDDQILWNDAVLIKQLISYAIGVTVGRYRLDRSGLHIAHPAPTSDELAAYDYCGKSVEIDDDAIIPILPDDSPFADNLCNRVKEFIRVVFGDDMLTANLNYIEQALGKPINDYLQKDFYTDHKKRYQNRPIYWLFSSKKGAFRCLVYMHRMNRFTVDRVRTKYLLPYIEYLENTIAGMESAFADLSTPERRQLDKYRKSLLECKEYHTALHNVANRMIEFDLDDGVLHNYQLFTPVLAKLK